MRNRGLSQEWLKTVACVTMLLDHIGVVIVWSCFQAAAGDGKDALLELYKLLRIIGRLAFPIYCFLLTEGAQYTKNPKRYGLRLLIGAVLAELPYDLAIYGGITWAKQSVMLSLLLGFIMLMVMQKCSKWIWKLLTAVFFAALAGMLNTDYGSNGILVIALFALTRNMPYKRLLQLVGLWWIFSPGHLMLLNWLGGFSVTVQEWAVLAMIPIGLYSGEKRTGSKALQWGFYLFYPVHLIALYFLKIL